MSCLGLTMHPLGELYGPTEFWPFFVNSVFFVVKRVSQVESNFLALFS